MLALISDLCPRRLPRGPVWDVLPTPSPAALDEDRLRSPSRDLRGLNPRKDQPPAEPTGCAEHDEEFKTRAVPLCILTTAGCHGHRLSGFAMPGAIRRRKDVLFFHLHPLNFHLMMFGEEILNRSDLRVKLVRFLTGMGRPGLPCGSGLDSC